MAKFFGLLIGLTAVMACRSSSLPTAPSQLANGIVLYEHANFAGEAGHATISIPDLQRLAGPCKETIDTPSLPSQGPTTTDILSWNDCISSIRVAPGWRATIYRDSDFRGEFLELASDVPNLQLVPGRCSRDGLNDCISSIRVTPP